ncbi:MAG: hypothetical protein NVSMB52_03540 [Chloroflexota bacterium]
MPEAVKFHRVTAINRCAYQVGIGAGGGTAALSALLVVNDAVVHHEVVSHQYIPAVEVFMSFIL